MHLDLRERTGFRRFQLSLSLRERRSPNATHPMCSVAALATRMPAIATTLPFLLHPFPTSIHAPWARDPPRLGAPELGAPAHKISGKVVQSTDQSQQVMYTER